MTDLDQWFSNDCILESPGEYANPRVSDSASLVWGMNAAGKIWRLSFGSHKELPSVEYIIPSTMKDSITVLEIEAPNLGALNQLWEKQKWYFEEGRAGKGRTESLHLLGALFFHFCFLLVWKLSTLIYFCHSFLTPILNCFLTFCYTNEMFSARLIVFPYCGIEWKYYKHLSYGRTFMAHLRVVAVYLGEGNGTLLQYFCLENPMDGGAW